MGAQTARRAGGSPGRRFSARQAGALLLLALSLAGLETAWSEELRVATYNPRNYLSMDRWTDGSYFRDYPKPEAAKAEVRRAIRAAQPHLLALQEIGSAGHLAELRADLAAEGLEFDGGAVLVAADPERKVAFLWRGLEEVRIRRHADLRHAYFGREIPVKRGLLEASFRFGGRRWLAFAVHLKSKRSDRKDDPLSAERRLGEARAVRARIVERIEAAGIARALLLGDLNAGPGTPPVAALAGAEDAGPALRLLDCRDARGEAWTYFYRKGDVRSRVDYVAATAAALEGWEAEGRVDGGPGFFAGSDHRLVSVRLRRAGEGN